MYDVLHREHFTHEHPADGHDAQRRGERGQEEQRQHRARRVFAVGEKELDGPDGQIAQRTDGYGQQYQASLAQPVYQKYRENVADHAERIVRRLCAVIKYYAISIFPSAVINIGHINNRTCKSI